MSDQILKTWKLIGKFLGMSMGKVKKEYAKSRKTKDPMPIIINGTIRAFPDELQAWKERQDNNLKSLKEIASFLGMSVMNLYIKRQIAQDRKDPLPFFDGSITKEEVKVWFKRQ